MNFSIEFFPPKDDLSLHKLRDTVRLYANEVQPSFMSLTCGAGGSNSRPEYALATIEHMSSLSIPVVAHLPHANRSRRVTMDLLKEFHRAGASMVLALRGDLPDGAKYKPHEQGFEHTTDLITEIRSTHPDIAVFVAGYPEKHPDSPTTKFDLENLKRKIPAGATVVLEQFCFDSRVVSQWHRKCSDHQVDIPLIPGMIAVLNYGRLCDIAKKCEATIPAHLHSAFGNLEMGSEKYEEQVIATMEYQLRSLHEIGENRVHVYALNSPKCVEPLARLKQELSPASQICILK